MKIKNHNLMVVKSNGKIGYGSWKDGSDINKGYINNCFYNQSYCLYCS